VGGSLLTSSSGLGALSTTQNWYWTYSLVSMYQAKLKSKYWIETKISEKEKVKLAESKAIKRNCQLKVKLRAIYIYILFWKLDEHFLY
jgi:hypothetical protein